MIPGTGANSALEKTCVRFRRGRRVGNDASDCEEAEME